jgi:tellurite resistance protein
MKNTIEKLRGTKISDDEYKIFILTYPLFLIAIADGTFDPEEKDFMKNILYNFLNPLYKDNITQEQYENLIDNYILDFEELFRSNDHKVEILTEFSKFDQEVKNAILELLNEVANISDGISEQEKLEISNIQNYI